MITDEELYRRLLGGDEGALEALVHRYHGPLLGFLYRQTGDRYLAEDLVQEAFTRLITYRGQVPQRLKAWAFTIAANLARDYLRSAYHRREQADAFEVWGEAERSALLTDNSPGADELLLRDADRREVVEALQLLSPAHRETVILRFYHDLRIDEVAEVTGVPAGTVKSRLFHALTQLKVHLTREGGVAHAASQS